MDTPTNKPLILFDIDETLINTDQLRILQRKTLADTLQKSDEDIANCFIEYYGDLEKTSDFDPDEFLAFASEKFGFPLEKLKDAFFQPTNFQMVLYPEVVETLANLRNKGYTLGIYSQGIRYSQEYKILVNNLMDFFDQQHRYVLKRKMDPAVIADLPENTIIIDDKAEVIEFLERFPNVIPLHIVRGEQNHVGEYTLSTLRDLFPILDTLRNAVDSEQ